MSLQKQFEGPDVRALLDEIRATYGSDPTISRAETFRAGGVLGFFQRERYRLVVEGEPLIATGAAPAALAGPAGQPPLADRAAGAPEPSPRLALAAYAAIAGRNGSVPSDPFALLADETVDSFESAPAGLSALSARSLHPAAAQAVPARSGLDLLDPDGTVTDRQPPVGGIPSFETVLQRVADLVDRPDASPMIWPDAGQPPQATEPPRAGGPSEPGGHPAPAAPPVPTEAALVDAEPPAPEAPEPSVEVQPDEYEPPAAAESLTEDRADLRLALYRAGFDPGMAADIERSVDEQGLEGALLQLFEELPEAPRPPRRNGSLVVVVGPGRRALDEATRIAAEVGTDPASVAFACERRAVWPTTEELLIHSAEDAMEMAPGHRRGRVGVVAVNVPVGASSTAWARHVIHALRPTLGVGVVDAMYKNEDIDSWVRALDGVDALVVDNTDVTTSPARVLDLEVPVSRLGEQPATPARWTATVLDRIGAEGEVEG